MSALAAMFSPPKVRRTSTRIVVSGYNVSGIKDLPPMPDAESRAEAKRAMRLARMRRYYQENKAAHAVRRAKWMAANSERQAQSVREWREKNPERYREITREGTRRYRARKRGELA